MYVHREHKVGFFAHPRTASKSIAHVLRHERGFELVKGHHGDPHRSQRRLEERLEIKLDPEWDFFGVVRNHYDVLAGWYWNSNYPAGDFGVEYLEQTINGSTPKFFKTQTKPFYRLFVFAPYLTHTLRYETLQSDFSAFLRGQGIEPIELPRRNVSENKKKTARELFGPQEVEWVKERFAVEMKRYGYFNEFP